MALTEAPDAGALERLVAEVDDRQAQLCALDVHDQRDDYAWCTACGCFLAAGITLVIGVAA